MAKWIEQYDVPGSNGNVYKVSRSADGEFQCACPRWIYRRESCKHIDQVRAGLHGKGKKIIDNIMVDNVGQVTIDGDRVLYPSVPMNQDLRLRLTIVHDFIKAGVSADLVKEYWQSMIGKEVPLTKVMERVRRDGRFIYSRFVKGQGWTDPIMVSAETPVAVKR